MNLLHNLASSTSILSVFAIVLGSSSLREFIPNNFFFNMDSNHEDLGEDIIGKVVWSTSLAFNQQKKKLKEQPLRCWC